MDAEKLKKIEEVYHAVLEIAPNERQAFLNSHCGDDHKLRLEVESLLAFEKTSGNILDSSPKSIANDVFFNSEKTELTGTQILHYKIKELLGKGGMGEVYLAEDTNLNRQVALKVLPAELIQNRDRLRRFEQEARAASALNHPNILTIHEFRIENNLPFIVMEFVKGKSLSEKISVGSLSLNETLDIAVQVASALSEAHEAGIIHRDIKPENLMVRLDGYVKVLDFGLAKLGQSAANSKSLNSEFPTQALLRTQPGMIMGTAAYMSPEQARGKQTDARTDIWSLGVVIYEMLTSQKPFSGETNSDTIVSVLSNEPSPISSYRNDAPAELEWMISKSLSKDVDERYQSSKELLSDLKRIKKNVEFRTVSRTAGGSEQTNTIDNQVQPTISASGATSIFSKMQNTKAIYPILALVLLAVISTIVYFTFFSTNKTESINSIAVLPFDNPSGNADLTFISDGLSEALIDRLSQLPQLKVIARNSSFAFRGANENLRDIGKKLEVQAIVTGNISRAGDDLIIRVDVVNALENTHLTGGSFRRKVGDVLGIQTEIARLTAEKLQLKMSPSQTKRLAENDTENSDAYRLYLSGLVELNGPMDVQSRALEYFEEAVKLDPNFTAAHTEIAWIYWSRSSGGFNPQELIPKAKAATERALELDPEYAKAHVLKALLNEYEFDWQGAEKEYQRAISLSPNLNFAHSNYAFFLSVMNRQQEALDATEQQRIRDPLNQRLAFLQKAVILVQARRFDEALDTYGNAVNIEPNKEVPPFAMGYAFAGKGLYKEAISFYKRAIDILGGQEKYSQPLVYLAWVYAKIPEKRAESQAILKRIETMNEYSSPALVAAVYSALGENDKAMELLEKSYKERDPLVKFIKVAYEYDGLRNEPRFIELLNRIGLNQ